MILHGMEGTFIFPDYKITGLYFVDIFQAGEVAGDR